MVFHVEYARVVPERKPAGHIPKAPRYGLRWRHPVSTLTSDYFALQGKDIGWDKQQAFFALAKSAFAEENGPDSSEIMRSVDELGYTNAIVVAYWTDPVKHGKWCIANALLTWFSHNDRLTDSNGVWRETLAVPYDRHETIYSGPDYLVGFGRTVGSEIVSITQNGYFGAARDRIPVAAIDTLASPFGDDSVLPPKYMPAKTNQRLRLSAPLNVCTLRSGQYWAHAETEQLDDYVENMQPKLMRGMGYLTDNKSASGTLSLRIMTNLNEDGSERKETSVYAHFLSLSHLERWAASHETHHAIYHHAIAMNVKYKQDRQFVSWHELFVLNCAVFEYVNCHSATGLLPYFPADRITPCTFVAT